FALADLSGEVVPLAISGASDYAYSKVAQVKVMDWNGAERLVVTNGSDAELDLTVDEDWSTFPHEGINFEDARWSYHRGGIGPAAPPVVEVVHVCPTLRAGTPAEVNASYPLSWSEVDDAVTVLSSGWASLSMILPERSADLSALLVRPPTGETNKLSIESHGIGPILTLDAEEVEEDVWAVTYEEGALSLSGQIEETDAGLSIRVEEGTLLGLPLSAMELVLSEYGVAEVP
ncbi:MAG: hypothetical protein AAFV53_43775, partial [Myxococcota bacterium]